MKEQQLVEKLLTVPTSGSEEGQVVIMAGGPGSGKDFAINNFTNINNHFKVLDIDEINRLILKTDNLFKKFREWLEKKNSPYADYSEIELRDDQNILKDDQFVDEIYKFLIDSKIPHTKLGVFLRVNKNKEHGKLPNVALNTTFGNIGNIKGKVTKLIDNGYKPENIHLVWVFTTIEEALQNNQARPRSVSGDYLTDAHKEVFSNIMGNIIGNKETSIFSNFIKGNVWVIINKKALTKFYDNSKTIRDFYYIHLKDSSGWNELEIKKFVDWVMKNTEYEVPNKKGEE